MPASAGTPLTLYTVPSSTTTVVIGLTLCNIHTTTVTADVQLVSDTSDTETNETVLLIKDVMDKTKDNLGDLKVSKDEIIENVAEKILTQEKSVAVVDSNNKIIGSINPAKIINTVFGGRKNNN